MKTKIRYYLVIISLLIFQIIFNTSYAKEMYSETSSLLNEGDVSISSESACLMEQSTGKVLYEKNADQQFEPASVTKVMTLLLIMEALDEKAIRLEDEVTASMYASSMGGSQIWLEYGEKLSVDEMLKAIVVVSANDCTVAMAEHLSGSEEAFVSRMNEKASELGMKNTSFKNCTGLPADGHLTTARDIAIMTRELCNHKLIFNYTTIWMDSLRNGEMGLSNTNKLIRYYNGANGMKTGYTSSAGYCLSSTAVRDGLSLIATTMKANSSSTRFEDAKKLLDYGFANFSVYKSGKSSLSPIAVKGGTEDYAEIEYNECCILLPRGRDKKVETVIDIPEYINAPVEKGQKVGEIHFVIDKEEIGKSDIVASTSVKRLNYFDILTRIFKKLIMFR